MFSRKDVPLTNPLNIPIELVKGTFPPWGLSYNRKRLQWLDMVAAWRRPNILLSLLSLSPKVSCVFFFTRNTCGANRGIYIIQQYDLYWFIALLPTAMVNKLAILGKNKFPHYWLIPSVIAGSNIFSPLIWSARLKMRYSMVFPHTAYSQFMMLNYWTCSIYSELFPLKMVDLSTVMLVYQSVVLGYTQISKHTQIPRINSSNMIKKTPQSPWYLPLYPTFFPTLMIIGACS